MLPETKISIRRIGSDIVANLKTREIEVEKIKKTNEVLGVDCFETEIKETYKDTGEIFYFEIKNEKILTLLKALNISLAKVLEQSLQKSSSHMISPLNLPESAILQTIAGAIPYSIEKESVEINGETVSKYTFDFMYIDHKEFVANLSQEIEKKLSNRLKHKILGVEVDPDFENVRIHLIPNERYYVFVKYEKEDSPKRHELVDFFYPVVQIDPDSVFITTSYPVMGLSKYIKQATYFIKSKKEKVNVCNIEKEELVKPEEMFELVKSEKPEDIKEKIKEIYVQEIEQDFEKIKALF